MNRKLVLASTSTFFLWGIVHVAGGAAMLASAGDPQAYLGMLATVDPASASLVPPEGSPANALLGFHAWNILWVGLVVAVIAILLNRRNSPAGFWINLALVSGADIGLLLFMVMPGVMALPSAAPGLVLWIPAAILGFLALRSGSPQPIAVPA